MNKIKINNYITGINKNILKCFNIYIFIIMDFFLIFIIIYLYLI